MHAGKQSRRAPARLSALQAFWPALQVLGGDVEGALAGFEAQERVWRRFNALPEVVDLRTLTPLHFARDSPIRPGASGATRRGRWLRPRGAPPSSP